MSPEDRAILISDITDAIKSASTLTDDEHRWVKMAIQKEAQSIELRKAIIEKTLTSLVWLIIVGIGMIFLDWATQHGYKP
tara:strand:- start:154 stop:393 length:240 start_codon:yes stop_codon:yes gene_type:complete